MFDDKKIESFKAKVYKNRISLKDIRKISRRELPYPSKNPLYVIDIGPYNVCFTVEEQPTKKGSKVFKHISISGPARGKLPNAVIIDKILGKFDFEATIRKTTGAYVYVENLKNGEQAINIMEAHLEKE